MCMTLHLSALNLRHESGYVRLVTAFLCTRKDVYSLGISVQFAVDHYTPTNVIYM